jgi:hypothetical protein
LVSPDSELGSKRYEGLTTRDQSVTKIFATRSLAELRVAPFQEIRLSVGKTYSGEYVSTYPRQQWRGQALFHRQAGPTSFSLFPLLLPPSPLLFPTEANGTEGNRRRRRSSGRLRPSPAELQPPEELEERAAPILVGGGPRGGPEHWRPRPWRTAARASPGRASTATPARGKAVGRVVGGWGRRWWWLEVEKGLG